MYRKDKIKYQLNALNEQLKELETYEDLKSLQKEMASYPQRYQFKMKKSGYEPYGFLHLYEDDPKYENKVRYLLSDGSSTRESYVKNLYRNIEVVY